MELSEEKIMFISILIIGSVFSTIYLHNYNLERTLCRNNGFDFKADIQSDVEEGYMRCCKDVIVNHVVKHNEDCKIVRKE